jgi:hypothetical protein
VFRPRSLVLRDGRKARIRRAEARDASAVLAHMSEVAAEGIYLMTEHFQHSVKVESARILDLDRVPELTSGARAARFAAPPELADLSQELV